MLVEQCSSSLHCGAFVCGGRLGLIAEIMQLFDSFVGELEILSKWLMLYL